MTKDISWNLYFENNERFADFINACGCHGKQLISGQDLQELDSKNIQSSKSSHSTKYRDMIRKVVRGIQFMIIGIEHQETINYSMPLTIMQYDTAQYHKQHRRLSRKFTPEKHLTPGELLYKFKRKDKLHPVATFVLYAGKEPWDGATELHQILDMSDIPAELQALVQNYKINLIDIHRWEDTSVFQTDLKQIFDFIQCSLDKSKLQNLIEKDKAYQHLAADTFELICHYTNIKQLETKEINYTESGYVNMCKAMEDWEKEATEAGKEIGEKIGREAGLMEATKTIVLNMLDCGMKDEEIMKLTECSKEFINSLRPNFS